jgi:hypothetical protein
MTNKTEEGYIMKKAAFIFAIVFALLVSCENELGSIINNSGYTISVKTTKDRQFTLSPGESIGITYYREYIESFSATPPRVSMKEVGNNVEFYNTLKIGLYVYNTKDKPVELYAQDCIGDGPEPANIAGDFTGDTTLGIYNSNPVFTAFFVDSESGIKYPATVTYIYNPQNNLMTATIR